MWEKLHRKRSSGKGSITWVWAATWGCVLCVCVCALYGLCVSVCCVCVEPGLNVALYWCPSATLCTKPGSKLAGSGKQQGPGC